MGPARPTTAISKMIPPATRPRTRAMIAKMNAAASKGSDKRNKSTGAANGANAAISAHTPPIAAGEFFRQDAALKRVELGLQLPVVVFPFGEWLPFVGTL